MNVPRLFIALSSMGVFACGGSGALPLFPGAQGPQPSTAPDGGTSGVTPTPDPPITGLPTDDPPKRPPAEWPEIQKALPQYRLEISEANLQLLEENIDDRRFSVPGTFVHDGRSWSVEVRYRGRHTRYLPKKSWEVKFPDSDRFHGGVKELELLAEWKDAGMLSEKMWFDLAAVAGVRVPRTQYVRLDINSAFYGVFLEVESIKKAFLRDHMFFMDSDIYRCGQYDCELRESPKESYQENWVKQTNEDQPWDELWAFLAVVNRSTDDELGDYLPRHFDLEPYLQWLAVDAAISNDTIGDSRSYLIYDRAEKRWVYVPWDLNNAVSLFNRTNGWPQWPNTTRPLKNFTVYDPVSYELAEYRKDDPWLPGVKPAWSSLNTRIWDDPELRGKVRDNLTHLLDTHFTLEVMGPRAEAYAALLAPHLAQDPHIDQQLAKESAAYLKKYVESRARYLRDHLHEFDEHGQGPLRLGELQPDGDRYRLTIANDGDDAIDLSGYYVTGWLRTPEQQRLGAITVPARGTAVVELSSSNGFHIEWSRPQLGLFGPDARTAHDVRFLKSP